MEFTTRVPIGNYNNPIDYNSSVVSLGSCFAVNIGAKFDHFKFRNSTNPFGILFHPLALEKFVSFVVNKNVFTEADIFFHEGRWHCFDAHSELSEADPESFLRNLNNTISLALTALAKASHLIITLGTAWVYRHTESGNLVANCHKIPQKQFTKELLDVDEIPRSVQNIIEMAMRINPGIQFIFTVSPVRHIKDGFAENQRSKAHLLAGLHNVIDSNSSAIYFPSYEIMMDELRDYRFYTADMIHPSQQAIDYIWQRFADAFISPESKSVMAEVDSIQRGLSHRPFNPESEQHQKFLQALQNKITALHKKYPHIAF